MSKIVAIRIDSRLIHGQTANLWNGYWNCDRYIVIDDETASNPTLKSVMRIAAPAGIKLSVVTEDKAVEFITDPDHYGNEKLVIITKWLTSLTKLMDAGVKFDCDINVGTMVLGKGRDINVAKSVKVNADDIKYFHYLADHGANIVYQIIPTMAREQFMPLLEKAVQGN